MENEYNVNVKFSLGVKSEDTLKDDCTPLVMKQGACPGYENPCLPTCHDICSQTMVDTIEENEVIFLIQNKNNLINQKIYISYLKYYTQNNICLFFICKYHNLMYYFIVTVLVNFGNREQIRIQFIFKIVIGHFRKIENWVE